MSSNAEGCVYSDFVQFGDLSFVWNACGVNLVSIFFGVRGSCWNFVARRNDVLYFIWWFFLFDILLLMFIFHCFVHSFLDFDFSLIVSLLLSSARSLYWFISSLCYDVLTTRLCSIFIVFIPFAYILSCYFCLSVKLCCSSCLLLFRFY